MRYLTNTDVLVLQVEGGKDSVRFPAKRFFGYKSDKAKFISINSTYLPSLAGLPLTQLVKLPEGIRQLSFAERRRLSDATPLLTPKEEEADPYVGRNDEKTAKPARVLWRLLESLMEHHDGELWKGRPRLEQLLAVIEVSSRSPRYHTLLISNLSAYKTHRRSTRTTRCLTSRRKASRTR
jgi:hypothetical protein